MKNATARTDPPIKRSPWRRARVWIGRALLLFVGALLFYALSVLVGLIPVNNDFTPADEDVEIFLISSQVHVDIIVPIESDGFDWRERVSADCFEGDTKDATHYAFGWGDRTFSLETPTWDEFQTRYAAEAVFVPTRSVMHVSARRADRLPESARSVTISRERYGRLVEYIDASFRKSEDGSYDHIAGAAYHDRDAFFEGVGYYHAFNTCNCWAGGAMKRAGLPVGWFTPLPGTVFLYLPEEG